MDAIDTLLQNPASSGVQLIALLNGLLNSTNQANTANAAASRTSSDLDAQMAGLTGDQATLRALVQALSKQLGEQNAVNPLSEISEAALANREAQRFSALVPSIDRANALAASQLAAKNARTGMADSTAARDAQGGLTRQFADVYARLQENARTTAFQEAMEKLKSMLSDRNSTSQQLSSALNSLAAFGQSGMNINMQRMRSNQSAAQTAADAKGAAIAKILDSALGKRLMGYADTKLGELLGANKQEPPTTELGQGVYFGMPSPTNWNPNHLTAGTAGSGWFSTDEPSWSLGGSKSLLDSVPHVPATSLTGGYQWQTPAVEQPTDPWGVLEKEDSFWQLQP